MTPEFSRPLALRDIGEKPHVVELKARPEERRALVARFGLEDLSDLAGALSVYWRGEEVVVEGTIRATATQACIVTLEPVDETIDEEFVVIFAERAREAQEHEPPENEFAAPRELVEPLEGDSIDLGELLAQQLSLALNPYPRAEGAELPEEERRAGETQDEQGSDESANPFAVLKQLKSND